MTETRWAISEDIPALDAFLLAHADRAMFPLTNLRRYGVDGDSGGGLRACCFHLTLQDDRIVGAVGVDQTGSLLPVGNPALRALRVARAGQSVSGVLGETTLVRQTLTALGIADAPATMNDDEPHFNIDLDHLVMPRTTGLTLLPLSVLPREQAIAWRAAYAQETLGDDPETAAARAITDIDGYLEQGTHRSLWLGDQPVAMTGFNAVLPEIVQVGAVYTPPALRGRGYARAAVALHLAQARSKGATRSVLFAASVPAAKAYRALGFQNIGYYSIILYKETPIIAPVVPEVGLCP